MPTRLFPLLLLLLLLLLAGCIEEPTRTGPVITTTPSSPVTVYFSDPLSGATSGGPDADLVDSIDAAGESVDMAIYNLTLPNVAQALVRAHERGVRVRLVMESEAMDKAVPQSLARAGIPITGDNREGLMHNKFTVIDNNEVWTGSANYTSTGFYQDYNNILHVRSKQVASNYTTEFEEMFLEDLFGPDSRSATPYPDTTINGIRIQTAFSPDDRVANTVVDLLRGAQASIDFLAYSFTRDDFAQAIRERAAAGVAVRGVFDEEQVNSNTGGEFDALKADGFDVRKDGIRGLMHHKVIIIDGSIVITGSYNFSRNADRVNDENVLILHDPAIAQEYRAHFEEVWSGAK